MSSLVVLIIAIIVIQMFPQLFFLLTILWLGYTVINILRGPRRNPSNPYQRTNPFQGNDSNNQNRSQRPKGDVIDVEFTETEVKEDK